MFDKTLLCAFIGALDHQAQCNSKVCKTVVKSVKQWGLYHAILTTLEEIMQVCPPITLLHHAMFKVPNQNLMHPHQRWLILTHLVNGYNL